MVRIRFAKHGLLAAVIGVVGAWRAPSFGQVHVEVNVGGHHEHDRDRGMVEGVEILTRGPVHEAFAQVAEIEPVSLPVVDVEPPAPLDESPPDETIDFGSGEVDWIPGYWAFDDDRHDFIWISGIWRTPPPGCSWIPGYWTRTSGGYRYTAGVWMPQDEDDDDDEIEYLPSPPRSVEEGPPGPPPSPRHVWVPGVWYWDMDWSWESGNYRREGGYVWRPGHWIVQREGWIWVPAHYARAPRGYLFVDGHWDYPLDRRGVLYAPVAFERPVYRAREYHYAPTIAVDVDVIVDHLFRRGHTAHYYFGDYYAPEYASREYVPWFETVREYRAPDPLYAQTRVRRISVDVNWEANIKRDYRYRVEHVEARPARLYREQETVVRTRHEHEDEHEHDRDDHPNWKRLVLAKAIDALTSDGHDGPRQVRTLSSEQRETINRRNAQVRAFVDRRKNVEVDNAKVGARDDDRNVPPERQPAPKAEKVKLEKSPVSGRAAQARSRAPEKPTVEEGPPPPKKVRTRTKSDDRGQADKAEKRPAREDPRKPNDDDKGKDDKGKPDKDDNSDKGKKDERPKSRS